MAAQFLSDEYVTKKLLMLLGDGDKADEILQQMDANAQERMGGYEVIENE